MKRQGKIAGIVVILVIIIALAAPYIAGLIFKDNFRTFVNVWAQNSSVPITLTSYDQGWFQSTAVTQIGPESDGLRIQHVINHNPLSTFTFAVIKSTPITDDAALLKKIKKNFGDKSAWAATSRVSFSGALDIHMTSPALKQPIHPRGKYSTVAWQGMTLDFHVDDSGMTYDASMPHFLVDLDNKKLILDDLVLQGSVAADRTRADIHFAANQVLFDDSSTHIKLAFETDIHSKLQGDNKYGATFDLEINDLTVDAADMDDSKPFKLSTAALKASVAGIPAHVLWAFIDDLKASYNPARPQSAAVTVMGYVPELLTDSTKLEIHVPKFDSNHGQLNFHATASFDRLTNSNSALPTLQLVRRLNAHLKFAVDKTLAQFALTGQARRALPALVKNNVLKINDGRYTMTLEFNGPKQFTINGRPGAPLLMSLRYALQ